MTGEGISLAGYGYPGAIAAANPTNTLLDENDNWFGFNLDYAYLMPVGFEWMCYEQVPSSNLCSSAFLQGLGSWNVSGQVGRHRPPFIYPIVGNNKLARSRWVR